MVKLERIQSRLFLEALRSVGSLFHCCSTCSTIMDLLKLPVRCIIMSELQQLGEGD